MQTVTVGPKYQVVIPKEVRKKTVGLNPGIKVAIKSVNKNTITIEVSPLDWIERTAGIMAEAWKSIDPIKELEKMRNEWGKKP